MFEDILKYSSHILRENKSSLLSSQGIRGKLYKLKIISKNLLGNLQDPALKRSKAKN